MKTYRNFNGQLVHFDLLSLTLAASLCEILIVGKRISHLRGKFFVKDQFLIFSPFAEDSLIFTDIYVMKYKNLLLF